MIDGVRMRLLVMVWKITVEAALGVPTRIRPSPLPPRNTRMKSHEPRAWPVMNRAMAMTARTSRTVRLSAGEKRPQRRRTGLPPRPRFWPIMVSADTRRPPEQHYQEQCPADETDHRSDRNLIRKAE